MYSLDGKVALVTGAARGQGAEEAALLARHGAKVVLTDILDADGEKLAQSLDGDYRHLDVSDESGWTAIVDAVAAKYGRLDILVNNAAISHFARIEDTSTADFQRVISVNLLGVFLGMRAVVPIMKRTGGSIINISSIGALAGRSNIAAYCSSKWGVRGLTKTAALEFGPYGIRANSIVPGLIDTVMTREAYGEAMIASRGAQIPVGRAGTPTDIANLVLFLASDQSSFCSGAEFVADGGETAGK
jgi:3alpha(or 20beta)-hydroxysteroid dehydrogenase